MLPKFLLIIKILCVRFIRNRNKLFIILGILLLLSLNFLLKPYLHQREVIRIVETVLINWQHGDLTLNYAFWKNPEKSPPIYGLISYKIKNKDFSKRGKLSYAKISATLEFAPDNITPSGKDWVFELEKDDGGWKIVNFRLTN